MEHIIYQKTYQISIHAPARGATTAFSVKSLKLLFQSTLPRGERPAHRDKFRIAAIFQSALPRGERQTTYYRTWLQGNFNPRSREGSDTLIQYHSETAQRISIRAPARGATLAGADTWSGGQHFNPRSREGSDPGVCIKTLGLEISIRAPARGATLMNKPTYQTLDISIRAPARGATLSFTVYPFVCKFQSALPRGERHASMSVVAATMDFNPRSREGSDLYG